MGFKFNDERLSQALDPGFVEEFDDPESYKNKVKIFTELWDWLEKDVYRTTVLKGWNTPGKERNAGELIALMHSELSEALEGLRHGNNPSEHIPEVSAAEEEFADVVIRMMDMAFMRKWNIPKALILKIRFNKQRPYKHGGKKF